MQVDNKGQSAAVQRAAQSGLITKLSTKGFGQNWLPKVYRRVEIKQSQWKTKFEEFDFSYYNKTRFAGLENDIVNSYCNALLQVRLCHHTINPTYLSEIHMFLLHMSISIWFSYTQKSKSWMLKLSYTIGCPSTVP